MSELLKHISSGMKNAIILDTPDFSINNQYLDMENIGKDIKISIKILDKDEQTRKQISSKNKRTRRR